MKSLKILGLALATSLSLVACNEGGSTGTEIRESETIEVRQTTETTEVAQTTTGDFITVDEARDIAFADAGVTDDTIPVKVKRDVEDGRDIYEVDFDFGGQEYDYEIDALTGEIVSADRDYKGGVNAKVDLEITAQEAEEIALKDAGLERGDVNFIDIDIDEDDGIHKYSLDFETATQEYEYEIDGQSGEILSKEIENR